jgi:hypothetical protein
MSQTIRHIFAALLLFFSLTLMAQQPKKKIRQPRVTISALNSSFLYLDKLNLVGIKLDPPTNDSLGISVSQGSFTLFDKSVHNIYTIFPEKEGILKIQAIKFLQDTQIIVGQKSFAVKLSPEQKTLNSLQTKPNISLGSYVAGKIPIDTIKKLNCLTIHPKYQLLSAMVYFSSTIGTGCTASTSISNNCFDVAFREFWNRISPGTLMIFSQIKIKDLTNKKIYILPDIGYEVVGK